MNGQGRHCPFLNRCDSRCSPHLSLDRLDHAFHHCCNQYRDCTIYAELLGERRQRRLELSLGPQVLCHDSPNVQITVARRIQRPLAASA